ncbi:MAG: AAA family ATPase, partial [Chloroflexi bacterium]|nr:AAA family ATPase [Chloroflexota bacterium]
GVDIKAQPPGKRVSALGLLSGGERALTAIALLFALLEVRPAPFCVLDEVDAALDEANVERFVNALQERASKTQFVLITHNRRTIEQAHSIYGVTMGAAGVSRLLSVRVDDLPHRDG